MFPVFNDTVTVIQESLNMENVKNSILIVDDEEINLDILEHD